MRAAIFCGPRRNEVADRPDPVVTASTDAVVRVVLACVCDSDLWFYRGETDYPPGAPVGHEFIGVVGEVGAEVHGIAEGGLVITPFKYRDDTCPHCRESRRAVSPAVCGESVGLTEVKGRRCGSRSLTPLSLRYGSTSPSCSMTSSQIASSPGASSTSRPTSTASRRHTPPWTSAARSSRSCGWERSDQHHPRVRAIHHGTDVARH
jgi:hypothetical protein